MSEIAVIDQDADDELVVRHPDTGITVMPAVTANDLVARLDVIRDAMRNAMQQDVDYGVIPGTGGKPTLLKPGSEKLGVLFQLDIQIENEKRWDGDHLTVMSKAVAYHAPTGTRLGAGEGMCSTRETKYAYRVESQKCPQCGEAAIIKGKAEYGGGWVCFKKKGGCGMKFADGDTAITGQTVGKVENPDLPDTWNTVLKMSEKRARIDAVLAVTGASALFTQDVGDDEVKPADEKPAVAHDGHQPATGAASWKDWEARMTALEVPRPMDWLRNAADAAGLAGAKDKAWGKALSVKANRAMLWFADNAPASEFWSVEELAAGWAAGFDGLVVEAPGDEAIEMPDAETKS